MNQLRDDLIQQFIINLNIKTNLIQSLMNEIDSLLKDSNVLNKSYEIEQLLFDIENHLSDMYQDAKILGLQYVYDNVDDLKMIVNNINYYPNFKIKFTEILNVQKVLDHLNPKNDDNTLKHTLSKSLDNIDYGKNNHISINLSENKKTYIPISQLVVDEEESKPHNKHTINAIQQSKNKALIRINEYTGVVETEMLIFYPTSPYTMNQWIERNHPFLIDKWRDYEVMRFHEIFMDCMAFSNKPILYQPKRIKNTPVNHDINESSHLTKHQKTNTPLPHIHNIEMTPTLSNELSIGALLKHPNNIPQQSKTNHILEEKVVKQNTSPDEINITSPNKLEQSNTQPHPKFKIFKNILFTYIEDMSKQYNKKIIVNMNNVEQNILLLNNKQYDSVKNIIIQLVKNSILHSIEDKHFRIKNKKTVEGHVSITLDYIEQDNLMKLIVEDDGAGFNQNRIKEQAIRKGLISFENALKLNNKDCLQLAFKRNFSTHPQYSGNGLVIVKDNIKLLKGNVNIKSDKTGSRIEIKFKLDDKEC